MLKNNAIFAFFLMLTINVSSAEKQEFRFDFTPDETSREHGCAAVNGKTLYSPERGYGWAKQWGHAYKDKQQKNALLQGSISAVHTVREAEFIVDLPNGVYEVELMAGSTVASEGRKGICMALEGKAMIAPPGIGGWGVVSKRKVPVLVEDGRLDIKFFIYGQGGAQRLNLFSLAVIPVEDKRKAEALAEKWRNAQDLNKVGKRKITIGGKEYIEIGRRNEIKPGRWITKYKKQNHLFYVRNNPGDILDYSIPKERELVDGVDAFASPGEDQPLYFGLYGIEKLKDVRVKLFPLRSKDSEIYPEHIEFFTVTCHPQSPSEVISSTAMMAPELLEKRIPFDTEKGKTQPLYVLVKVPKNQNPGIYKGKIRFAPQDIGSFELNVTLRVLPLEIKRPDNKVWHLYSDTARWFEMSKREMRKEIEGMAAHGINSLKSGMAPLYGAYVEENGQIANVDFGRIGEGMRYAAERGMNGPLLMSSTPPLAWWLKGWRLDKKGGSSYELLKNSQGNNLKITNRDEKAFFHISQSAPADLPSGEPVKLDVKYRMTGNGEAHANLYFRTLQRVPNKKSIKITLPPTNGKWKRLSATGKVPNGFPENLVTFSYRGGPGLFELKEIGLYGKDGMTNHVCNYQFSRPFENLDLNKPWPAEFEKSYKNAIKAYSRGAKELGFDIYIEGKDEAGNDPESEFQEITELKFAKEAGGKTWCNLSLPLAQKNSNVLDAVGFYGSLLGDEKSGLDIIDSFQKLGKEVYIITSGTYQGQDYDLMPNRYGVGYFFWKSKADGTGIWTFQRWGGDPFNDFDSRDRDHMLIYPPREKGGEPILTIGWEGIREGWRDYCYINTLEDAISNLSNNDPKRKQGEAVLDFIRKRIPWYNEFSIESFDNKEADKLRWLAAWTTMNLASDKAPEQLKEETSKDPELEVQAIKNTSEKNERPILCPISESGLRIDGKLDDGEWANAARINAFKVNANRNLEPEVETKAFLMHDKDNIYIGFKCYEPDMDKLTGTKREHDGNVFADESLEVFLDTNNDEFSFYQMCLNSAGSKFDMKCAGGIHFGANIFNVAYGKKKLRDHKWNCKWTVKTTRYNDRWEAEIAIPFSSVGRESDIWGIHLGRNRRIGKRNTFSNKAIGSFHQPEKFEKMVFSGARTGDVKLKAWYVPPFYYGQNEATFSFAPDFKGNLQSSMQITEKEGKKRTYKAESKEDSLKIPYRLNSGDKRSDILIFNANGNLLYEFKQAFEVFNPIEIFAKKQVFFKGKENNSATFKIILNLSDSYRKGGSISVSLIKDEAALKVFKGALDSSEYKVTVNAGDLGEGFYCLRVLVSNDGEKTLSLDLPVLVIPHYITQ